MNNVKRYFQFLLIVLAAGSIYPLLYLRANYQETILVVYDISLSQLNSLYSFLGISLVLGYFPSGWLADKFSAKKLMSMSLFICGLTGIWFAQIPSYPMLIIIYGMWGIFSVFTFWSAHLKIVKLIAKREEEGRFFGILDGGRGIVEAVLATVALFIFLHVLGNHTDMMKTTAALQGVVYLYSIVMIVVAVLILLFIKDSPDTPGKQKTNKIDIQDFKKVFNNKFVWLLGLIIFMSYTLAQTVHYIGGFLQTNLNMDVATVGQITVTMLWMRPIGGIVGGFLGDKFGKSNILMIALAFAAIFLITLASSPSTMSSLYFQFLALSTGLMVYTIRGLYWSLLGDCRISPAILGLSIGFISFIGYLPDFLAPVLNNQFVSLFGEASGQSAYLIFSGVAGLIAIFITFIFKRAIKRNIKKI